uniref:Uncharacterized protein n=1 Tax=Timema tahoe TaxID=61484 RepID=A0A7R9IMH6_9NEOP|nr:unnamed protein product [Timema tahoe]
MIPAAGLQGTRLAHVILWTRGLFPEVWGSADGLETIINSGGERSFRISDVPLMSGVGIFVLLVAVLLLLAWILNVAHGYENLRMYETRSSSESMNAIWGGMVVDRTSPKSVRLTAMDSSGQIKVFLVTVSNISSIFRCYMRLMKLQ